MSLTKHKLVITMTQLILPATLLEKQAQVRDLIAQYDTGRQFTIVNVKADGTLREYKAMTGVNAGLKGNKSTTSAKPNLITIFDTVANEYRAVNLDTVLFIDFGARRFIFTDDHTASQIKDLSVARPLDTAANIAKTALNVINKALGL